MTSRKSARLLVKSCLTRTAPFWNVIVCGSLSSVMEKSFAVSPSTGLPSLSLTMTVCTMSVCPVRKVGGCCACGATTKDTKDTKIKKAQPRSHEDTKKTQYFPFVFSCFRGCILEFQPKAG